jgi:CheY-like chemotaxis protein
MEDILVVDDTPSNLDVLCGMLQKHQYRVRVALNGARAIASAQASTPDLILLDINMPGMSGYEVCRELKSDPQTSSVPVIFISSVDEAVDKVRAFDAGGVDYVTKPFEYGEVLARVESQLKIARLQRDLERRNRELVRTNEELRNSQRRESQIFNRLSEVLPGTVIDERYRLEEKIGSGGFGTVYRAVQLNLNRAVAVKIFQSLVSTADPEDLARFKREGVSACRVNHSNALTVIDSGISSSGIAYLVTELLTGKTVASEIRELQKLPQDRAASIMSTVCDVLAVAHDSKILHRDVKPDNIFLHAAGESETVKVLDFGIAKLVGEKTLSTDTHMILGTPAYMSPERLRGDPHDAKSDVYSVAVTLFHMLTGEIPYKDMGSLDLLAHEGVSIVPGAITAVNRSVSEPVEQLVYEGMAFDAKTRPTMRDMKRRLEEAAG